MVKVLFSMTEYARILLKLFDFSTKIQRMNRSKGQTRLTMTLSLELLAELDAARGLTSRSEFIRLSLAEKLDLDETMVAPPDRVGVGGKPSHKPNKPDLAKVRNAPEESPQKEPMNFAFEAMAENLRRTQFVAEENVFEKNDEEGKD